MGKALDWESDPESSLASAALWPHDPEKSLKSPPSHPSLMRLMMSSSYACKSPGGLVKPDFWDPPLEL